MVVLGFECAEEALDHCVVKAVALATHALRYPAMRKHRPVRLHFVVPALIRMHGQSGGVFRLRECHFQRVRDELEYRAPGHAVRNDLAVVQIQAG